MRRTDMSEAERLAAALQMAQGATKEHMMMRRAGVPEEVMQMFLEQRASLTNGGLGLLAMMIFFLYDKCLKAGLVDGDSVDAQLLADFRKGIGEMRALLPHVQTLQPEEALEELHGIMKLMVHGVDGTKPKMPSTEAVIAKAKRSEDAA